MDFQLPGPIASYIRAENARDVEAISECFATYATVRDAEEYFEGRPAIKAWKAATPDQHITPIAADVADGTGHCEGALNGTFSNRSVTAELHVTLVGDQICSPALGSSAIAVSAAAFAFGITERGRS